MAIDVELAGLKAAGTYRFERDLSTISSGIATEAYSNLRLVVGFSKKGPFNSVQLITSTSQFIKLYGNIDRSLEKKGSYFHRSALAALSAGPILCMNLLSLDPENDQVMHRSISANIRKSNKNICTIPYQFVYNTDKFWFLSSESYLNSVHKYDNEPGSVNNVNNILNFVNVSNKPISVIVKKATANNIKGYEVTLNEWYGPENVPEYLNGTSMVSDYMVEVYVVGGDFGPSLYKGGKIDDVEDIVTYEYTDKCSNVYNDPAENPYKRFASDIVYQEYFDKYGFKADKLNKFLKLPSVNVIANYVGSLIPNFTNKLNQNIWIEDMINSDTLVTGLLCSEDIDIIESAEIDEESGFVDEVIDIIGHNFHAIDLNSSEDKNINPINFLSYSLSEDRFKSLISKDGDSDSENNGVTYIGDIEIHKKAGDVLSKYIDNNGTILNPDADNEIVISKEYFTNKDIKVGDLLLSMYSVNDVLDVNVKFSRVDNICDRYHWTFLRGFKVSDESMPDGTNERQNKILDMISEYNVHSNLYKTLIDRDYIQWRYIVDTFGLGIESECKKVYSRICQGRQSGFALVNAPSMKDFKKSTEPSFVDEYGAVKSEFIANGGNLDKAPVHLFSLPKNENGASWAAYFYPYLKISDLAAVKTVPPAAYVSNLFVAKYTASKPWAIVAGPKRGVISGNQVIGIEGSLIHDDREYLEPIGINPIVWENGVGVEIFANKTAKQTPLSALSSIHAREACIYIQDNVEDILKKYNWEANTARNREEIKTLVDTFLSNMKQGDGLYDFKTVMDTTNNTTEVIDRNMGVIDIYVEVVRGLEILAQRLTVLKTGSIESGNFE